MSERTEPRRQWSGIRRARPFLPTSLTSHSPLVPCSGPERRRRMGSEVRWTERTEHRPSPTEWTTSYQPPSRMNLWRARFLLVSLPHVFRLLSTSLRSVPTRRREETRRRAWRWRGTETEPQETFREPCLSLVPFTSYPRHPLSSRPEGKVKGERDDQRKTNRARSVTEARETRETWKRLDYEDSTINLYLTVTLSYIYINYPSYLY